MTLRERFVGGDGPIIGNFSMLADPFAAEVTGGAGLDCVIADMQHGLMGWDALLGLLQAFAISGTPALVRLPGNDAAEIGKVLDWGAAGVVVPVVDTVEDARNAVDAVFYPPQGRRSFGPVRAIDSQPVVVAMIETPLGMSNVEAIAALDGIDCLLVGPADLSLSHGMDILPPGAVPERGSELDELICAVGDACYSAGKTAGIAASSDAAVVRWYEQGFRFLTIAPDFALLQSVTKSAVDRAREAMASSALTSSSDRHR